MTDLAALAALQAENERLIKLLENHGIAWQSPQQTALVVRERESRTCFGILPTIGGGPTPSRRKSSKRTSEAERCTC